MLVSIVHLWAASKRCTLLPLQFHYNGEPPSTTQGPTANKYWHANWYTHLNCRWTMAGAATTATTKKNGSYACQHAQQPDDYRTRYGFSNCREVIPKKKTIQQGRPPSYKANLPALLQGPRCLTDASLEPDPNTTTCWEAGLGVIIINTQVYPTQSIHIEATISTHGWGSGTSHCSKIFHSAQPTGFNYLPDNQVMVNFFNAANLVSPPDWRRKSFAQDVINWSRDNQNNVYKIDSFEYHSSFFS